jgi:NAD(P)-dependent dehydrogenase (short-subunit alcohol dehydrogenase family)
MSHSAQRVAIITGAGSGIGLEAARQISTKGWALVLAGRTLSTLNAAGHSLKGPWLAVPGDVGDPAYAPKLIAEAISRFGGLDALINSAGVAPLATIPNHTPAMIQQAFQTNAIAPALLMAALWPALLKRGGGRIVNVSSMASIDPYDGFFAYAASKSALNMLTRIANNEGKTHNIRCFCVAPGAVETPMLRALFSTADLPTTSALDPADVAAIIVQCLQGQRDLDAGEPIMIER